MKIIKPNYYQNFQCIAEQCRHNCCIGWEIDIDEDTLSYYQALGGEMGARLKKEIATDSTPHFILGAHERCPFSNDGNLCDIITEYGGTIERETDGDERRVFVQIPGENAADFLSAVDSIGETSDNALVAVDEAAHEIGICVIIAGV